MYKGKVVLNVIKKSGVRITTLARRLGIHRSTLYRKLKQKELEEEWILDVIRILGHDFTNAFPGIKTKQYNLVISLLVAQRDYISLLENQNQLYGLAIKAIRKIDEPYTRDQIICFLTQQCQKMRDRVNS